MATKTVSKPSVYNPRVGSRVAPAPVSSGVSFRSLPPATFTQIATTCDHWLGKAAGDYASPASRWLFEMAHEVKALLEPLREEEARKARRLFHLEQLLAQWNEVFGNSGEGELASPKALAVALREQSATIERLSSELESARTVGAAAEARCLDVLQQHHRAHGEELRRMAERHQQEIEFLKEVHAAHLRGEQQRAAPGGGGAPQHHLRSASRLMLSELSR